MGGRSQRRLLAIASGGLKVRLGIDRSRRIAHFYCNRKSRWPRSNSLHEPGVIEAARFGLSERS